MPDINKVKKIVFSPQFAIFCVVSLLVFFMYAYFYFLTVPTFNSPDESANYFFSQVFSQTSSFQVAQPLDEYAPGYVHPRSILSANGYLVPASFLGTPLVVGSFVRFLGSWAIFFPALLTMLAGWCVGLLAYMYFDKNKHAAFFASILFWAQPAVWYFAARSLLPNILFIDFLVFSLMAYMLSVKQKSLASLVFVSGFFLGLSVIIRPSEVVWLIPLLLLCIVLLGEKSIKKYMFFFIGLALPILSVFFFNLQTYGGLLNTGYAPSGGAIPQFSDIGPEPTWWDDVKKIIFPFGIDVKFSAKIFFEFFLKQLWWYSVLLAAGLGYTFFAWKKLSKSTKILCLTYVILSFYMGIYYGSWRIVDNISGDVTIGASYMRYWLPIFIGGIPFIVFALKDLIKKKYIAWLLVIIYAILGGWLVWFAQSESLLSVRSNIEQYEVKRAKVFASVPEDAIVITYREDKFIFPGRNVVDYGDNNYADFFLIANYYDIAPVYFLSPLPDADMQFLQEQHLDQFGLQFSFVENIDERDRLFLLTKQE